MATGRSGEELHELITKQLDIKLIDPDQGRLVNLPISSEPLKSVYEYVRFCYCFKFIITLSLFRRKIKTSVPFLLKF